MAVDRGWPSKFIYLMKMSKGFVVLAARGSPEGVLRLARAPW